MLLELRGVSRSFGGLKAVQGLSLQVPENSLSALIGPNGAGKTTVFSLMSGFLKPDQGQVLFKGQDITGLAAHECAKLGLTRTFQIVQPFANQSVRENIAVGAHLHLKSRAQALAYASDVAEQVGLHGLLDQPAGELTVAARKRLELARGLSTRPSLLLLDEVLAGLNPQEIAEMLPVIQGIVQGGVSVLMIEHVMQAVMNLARHVWVLSQGELIFAGPTELMSTDQSVIEAYFGAAGAAKLRAAQSAGSSPRPNKGQS
jgi:branched-chain amino acid transport system ATP-binding protein